MIRLTALYPNTDGAHFDFEYYINTHLAMARRLLADYGMRGFQVLRCTRKLDGSDADYLCISHVEFESVERMQAGFAAHKAELSTDFAEYTNVVPQVHICESVGSSS